MTPLARRARALALVPLMLGLAAGALAAGDLGTRVTRSLRRSEGYLRSLQREDGSWLGTTEPDARVTAQYLLTMQALDRVEPERAAACARYLAAVQSPDGSFPTWPGGPADPSVTRMVALALRDAGSAPGRATGARARDWLASQPDLPPEDDLVRIHRAALGELPWRELPYVTPRLVSLPEWFHPNLYDLSFMRIAGVALAVLGSGADGRPRAPDAAEGPRAPERAPVVARPEPGRLRRWLREVGDALRSSLLDGLVALSRLADRVVPARGSREAAVAWLLERQEEDGSFASTFQVTALAALALHSDDPEEHREAIDAAVAAMHRWQVEDARGLRQQVSAPVTWDTASVAEALVQVGVAPEDPALEAAARFLVARQSLRRADWHHRAPDLEPGGWGFEATNSRFPNLDDTVRVLQFLRTQRHVPESAAAFERGLRWLVGMQSDDGGWAAWDRNDRAWLVPPAGEPFMTGDPSYADVTARALVLLGPLATGEGAPRRLRRAVRRGARFLEERRHGAGWPGYWAVHYLYGTADAVRGLRAAGLLPGHPWLEDAADWVESVQNPDGGFGESPASWAEGRFVTAASEALFTAYALDVLVAAGRAGSEAAERAAAFLVEAQAEDGAFPAESFNGSVVPGVWYLRYDLLPSYQVPAALARYQESR